MGGASRILTEAPNGVSNYKVLWSISELAPYRVSVFQSVSEIAGFDNLFYVLNYVPLLNPSASVFKEVLMKLSYTSV